MTDRWYFPNEPETEPRPRPNGKHEGGNERENAGPPVEPLAAWSLDDMLNLEPPSWVVDELLQLGTRALLFAPSGHHKTNLALDVACHVAHGLEWHGHAVTSHPVIVVATEDPHGAAVRTVGWHDHHEMLGGRVLIVPGGELRLNDPATIARLKATAEQHFPGERVGFVVDHYDVTVEGDPTATAEAVQSAAGLRELGNGSAFVLLLAHAPWTTDERAKVPVALWANVDARLKCERDEVTGRATLKLLHQKNGRSGLVLKFEFEEHAFSTRRGEANCLIARRLFDEPGESAVPKKDNLGDNEKLVLGILNTAISDKGRDIPPSHDIPPATKGVLFEEWEEAAERYMPPDKAGFRWRRDFKRAVGSLRTKHRYKLVSGWCYLPKKPDHPTPSHGMNGMQGQDHPTYPSHSHPPLGVGVGGMMGG